MQNLMDLDQWLTEHFAQLVAKHEIPGASIAVLAGDTVIESAAGVLNLDTNTAVSCDSIFQIGSVTKIWTATLVMQLVDEGLVSLDQPIQRYIPEFRVADRDASARITVRQLLTHTAGFMGDIFTDTTKDDDAVAKFVQDVLPLAKQDQPPGEMFSYNNAGYVVLGRLVEVMRDMPWPQALRTYLSEPLQVSCLANNAEEAILHSAAIGHIQPDPAGPFEPTKQWNLAYSNAPAGAVLSMSARDLLRLAKFHLDDGLSSKGERLLSSESISLMRQAQVDVPQRRLWQSRQGLGWALPQWPGGPVIGHDGNTIGQTAFMRLVPEQNVAVVLLTNGGKADELYQELFSHILATLTQVVVPEALQTPQPQLPISRVERYIGTFESGLVRLEVSADTDTQLSLTVTRLGSVAEAISCEQPQTFRLVRVEGEIFAQLNELDHIEGTCVFLGDDSDGRAAFMHNHRAIPRIA